MPIFRPNDSTAILDLADLRFGPRAGGRSGVIRLRHDPSFRRIGWSAGTSHRDPLNAHLLDEVQA